MFCTSCGNNMWEQEKFCTRCGAPNPKAGIVRDGGVKEAPVQDKPKAENIVYKIGTKCFDKWEITSVLGQGSFGTVYEISNREFGINSTAAMKVIRIPNSNDEVRSVKSEGLTDREVSNYFESFVNELRKEISVMSSLKDHPNIVSYEDHKIIPHADGIGWDVLIKMEKLTPLADYIRKHPLTEQEVITLGREICDALAYCESKSLIHRDIKPENIFVSRTGHFKLGDFGIAKVVEKTSEQLSQKGTANYMAPEVYFGRKYGPNADIYSLGLVLYRLMNDNRLPLLPPAPQTMTHEDKANAFAKRMSGMSLPAPLHASAQFADVILRACSFDAGVRYKNAYEMSNELAKIRPDEPGAAVHASVSDETVMVRGASLRAASDFASNDETQGIFRSDMGRGTAPKHGAEDPDAEEIKIYDDVHSIKKNGQNAQSGSGSYGQSGAGNYGQNGAGNYGQNGAGNYGQGSTGGYGQDIYGGYGNDPYGGDTDVFVPKKKKSKAWVIILVIVLVVILLAGAAGAVIFFLTREDEDHEHDYVETVLTEATCFEDGESEFECECGDSYTETIPAAGEHTFDDGIEVLSDSGMPTGLYVYTCLVCGETMTESYEMTGSSGDGGTVITEATPEQIYTDHQMYGFPNNVDYSRVVYKPNTMSLLQTYDDSGNWENTYYYVVEGEVYSQSTNRMLQVKALYNQVTFEVENVVTVEQPEDPNKNYVYEIYDQRFINGQLRVVYHYYSNYPETSDTIDGPVYTFYYTDNRLVEERIYRADGSPEEIYNVASYNSWDEGVKDAFIAREAEFLNRAYINYDLAAK